MIKPKRFRLLTSCFIRHSHFVLPIQELRFMKSRLIAYSIIIVLAVGVGVWYLSPDEPGKKKDPFTFSHGPAPPSNPFEVTPELEDAVNEDFGVEESREGNKPLAGTKVGADWPQFNGRRRDNKSDESGLLQAWPSGGPPLLWMARGLGEGYSTVSVVDGVVYTMGNKGKAEAVVALDAGTGERLWSTPIAWASRLNAGDGPRSTPTVGGDAVFALGGNGDLACLERKSGAIRWRKNILSEFGGGVPGWGICESVLVDDNRVICTPGGNKATIVALEPKTGDVIWQSLVPEKDRAGYASACIADVGGIKQYVQFTASGTIGVRADKGEFLWRENSAANGTANCSSPLIEGNLVFSASNYGTGGALVKLSPAGETVAAELVYKAREMKSHHGDMVIHDGLIYGSNESGILICLDHATGEMKWRDRSVGKGSITFADGRLYLRSESGKVALIEPNATKYREVGRLEEPHRTTSPAWAHPVIAHRCLFLRDQDLLLCYDLRKGEE